MIKKHLHFSLETILIGFKAGILACFFGLLQLIVQPKHPIFSAAMFGVFVTSIIETISISFPVVQRLRAGGMVAILAAPVFALGSICGGHYLLTLSMIVLFMSIVGISNPNNIVTANIILFIANLFIIGNGLPAPSIEVSLLYGLYFSLGSLSMFALEYFTLLPGLRKRKNVQPVKRNNPIFEINFDSALYSSLYVLTVATAYSISYYFKLSQGFWVPMTTLLIMKSCRRSSWVKIKHRFLGSLFGFLVALPIGIYFTNQLAMVLLLFPLYFFIVVGLAKNYGSYAFFLTIMVTDLYKLINFNGLTISLHRLFDTTLGLFIVVGVLLLRVVWGKLRKKKPALIFKM